MSLVPFEAFVDPRGRPGPLLRFPGGPASGLVVRREPTWVYWLSPSSSTVGAGGGPGFGVWVLARARAGTVVGAESNTKVRRVCTGSSAPTW